MKKLLVTVRNMITLESYIEPPMVDVDNFEAETVQQSLKVSGIEGLDKKNLD